MKLLLLPVSAAAAISIVVVVMMSFTVAASAFSPPQSSSSSTISSSLSSPPPPLLSPLDATSTSSSAAAAAHHHHLLPNQEHYDTPTPPPLKRSPPRNICLLIEPTPFTHVSGYANRFKEMLRYLSKAGDHVDILTVDAKTPKHDLPSDCFGYNIEHTQGFVFPLYDHISLTLDLPEMKGAKMMERKRPDLIHVTSPGFMLFAGLFYARVMRLPLLLSYHTHLPLYGRNYLGFIPGIEEMAWAALRFAHSRADLTLVTSPQMKSEMEKNGVPRVDVWRKGIDTVRFDPKYKDGDMRERMSNGHPQDFLMVYVGRLGAEKRLKDILPVLEKLGGGEGSGAGAGARLCIVGKGPQEEELKEYFGSSDAVRERVVFTGQLSGDELSMAFASADCFMMPSDSETLGFVVLESMASGVPVIGCAAGGIPDLIRHGDTGFLVPPGDIEAYTSCAQQLMNDTNFRIEMGKRARAEAELWGWEAATSVLRNVQYEKAMINFHSRAFGGFGSNKKKKTMTSIISSSALSSVWGRLRMQIGRVLGKLRFPGFRRRNVEEEEGLMYYI